MVVYPPSISMILTEAFIKWRKSDSKVAVLSIRNKILDVQTICCLLAEYYFCFEAALEEIVFNYKRIACEADRRLKVAMSGMCEEQGNQKSNIQKLLKFFG